MSGLHRAYISVDISNRLVFLESEGDCASNVKYSIYTGSLVLTLSAPISLFTRGH